MWHLGTRSLGMARLSLVVVEVLLPTASRYLWAGVAFPARWVHRAKRASLPVLLTPLQCVCSLPDPKSNIVCNYTSLTSGLRPLDCSTSSVCKNKRKKCKGHFMHSLVVFVKAAFSNLLPLYFPSLLPLPDPHQSCNTYWHWAIVKVSLRSYRFTAQNIHFSALPSQVVQRSPLLVRLGSSHPFFFFYYYYFCRCCWQEPRFSLTSKSGWCSGYYVKSTALVGRLIPIWFGYF